MDQFLGILAHGDGIWAWAASAPLLAGLAAGAVHVFAGPDHLAAIAPLTASRSRNERPGTGVQAWRTGLWWGIGHSGSVWMLAALALFFREIIPIDLISGWSERLVGLILIAVGIWAIRSALRMRIHAHEHTHDGRTHVHVHTHTAGHGRSREHSSDHAGHTHAPLGIGMLHGLAGTSHLVGVLPGLLMPTRGAAVVYVLAYGLGSIAAMTGFAHALGLLLRNRGERALRRIIATTGIAAVAVGAWWMAGA